MCFVLGLVSAAHAQESAGEALQRRQSALHAAADQGRWPVWLPYQCLHLPRVQAVERGIPCGAMVTHAVVAWHGMPNRATSRADRANTALTRDILVYTS